MTTKPKITDKQALSELETSTRASLNSKICQLSPRSALGVRERDEHDAKLVKLIQAARAQGVSWAHIDTESYLRT
jgi:hypothetical protein